MPCCSVAAPCQCALLVPPVGSPFASYSDAVAKLAGYSAGCIVYEGGGTFTIASLAASNPSPTQYLCSETNNINTVALYASITVGASTNLSIPWIGSQLGSPSGQVGIVQLMDCATGSVVYSDTNGGVSGTLSVTGIAAGTYNVVLVFTGAGAITSTAASFTVNSSAIMVVNPVIALWDDSGTTRQLEACPKMLIPPLTESTGDWYASCADAAADLSDPLVVSNCVGYYALFAAITSFTAVGGSSLAFSVVISSLTASTGDFWGSVNAVAGDTLTATGAGFPNVSMSIYDYTGTLVESKSGGSPQTSSPLPYTGRYILQCRNFVTPPGAPGTAGAVTVTSSGTMTTNNIQALWDNGLDCPSRLNCGDSC